MTRTLGQVAPRSRSTSSALEVGHRGSPQPDTHPDCEHGKGGAGNGHSAGPDRRHDDGRDGHRRIRYARVTAGRDAGTVEVTLAPARDDTEVTVTYRLTALTPEGAEWLGTFAAGYPAFLRSWESAITDFLHRRDRGTDR